MIPGIVRATRDTDIIIHSPIVGLFIITYLRIGLLYKLILMLNTMFVYCYLFTYKIEVT